MNDETLVNQCNAGNAKAQKMLFDQFSPVMMGVVLRYVNDSERANDVLQDGFIKVFKHLKSFKNEGSLEGWIRRIMVNTALDYIRKNKKFLQNKSLDEINADLFTKSEAIERLEEEGLLKIIQSLPDGYRMVFNLYAIEGYSHKEIAETLGISENTSKSQYSRAKTVLRGLLEKFGIER